MESSDIVGMLLRSDAHGNYVRPMIDVIIHSYSCIQVALYMVIGCIWLDCTSFWLYTYELSRKLAANPEASVSMLTQEFMESSTVKVILFLIIFLAPYLPLMCGDDVKTATVKKGLRETCDEPRESHEEVHGENGSWTMINTDRISSPMKEDSKSNDNDLTPPVRSNTNCINKDSDSVQDLQNLHDFDADHADCERDSATNDDVQTIDYSQDLEYERGAQSGTFYGCVYVDEIDVRNGSGHSAARLKVQYKAGDSRGGSSNNSSTSNSNENYDQIMQQSKADPRVLVGWQVAIQGHGVGFIVGMVKRKFTTTRFSVELESGEVVQLALQRGKHKGNVPFTLLQKLK